MKRETYHTKQKEMIMNWIQKRKKEFTIKDIYEEMNHTIGLTTIYRLIDKLVEEGELNKSILKDNTAHYQYLEKCEEENHFFLKCETCGNMHHIDCDCIGGLWDHIGKKHQFIPKKDPIIIQGICSQCVKEGRG